MAMIMHVFPGTRQHVRQRRTGGGSRPSSWRSAAVRAAAILLAAVAAGGAGCSRSVESQDAAELNNGLVQKAMSQEREGDLAGAVQSYGDALDRNPRLARAHLGLAFLLDRPDQDYLSAIYHYRRYLGLRPGTEKRRIIEERLSAARIAYAGTVFRQMPDAVEEVQALQAEIQSLRAELQRLKGQVSQTETNGTAATGGPSVAGLTVDAPGVRHYTVQSGDTLGGIARKVYRDGSKAEGIYRANRDSLRSRNDLRAGQVLVIP